MVLGPRERAWKNLADVLKPTIEARVQEWDDDEPAAAGTAHLDKLTELMERHQPGTRLEGVDISSDKVGYAMDYLMERGVLETTEIDRSHKTEVYDFRTLDKRELERAYDEVLNPLIKYGEGDLY